MSYGVYVPGAATPDAPAVEALAKASGLSLIDARMLLASPLPKRVSLLADREAAAALARELKPLDAFVVASEALARVRPRIAKACRFDGPSLLLDGVVFTPRLIVHGEIRAGSRVERNVIVEQDIGFRVEKRTSDRRTSAERFLRLYGEGHADGVEIRPRSFNFRGLGKDFASTSAGNVATFIDRLRSLFPGLKVDETLLRHPPLPQDVPSESETKLESNEEAAMRTSTLIALDLLRR